MTTMTSMTSITVKLKILFEPGYLGINIIGNIIRRVEHHSSQQLPSST